MAHIPVAERFWARVDKDGPWSMNRRAPGRCWTWTGAATSRGYGNFWAEGRSNLAHRWAHETHIGPIPAGLVIDHLCRNTSCVNPQHLEPVPQRINVLRGEAGQNNSRKTHCPAGHPYDAANTFVGSDRKRRCRTCIKSRARARIAA